ncbi:MAG: NnrU family protein [Robiginitomaculum sp.]|nr:NnrU family protein [Robiginitomaculum sp.]MDQ7077556.1 NnrU family protein [Robiginitomaculum sp.]
MTYLYIGILLFFGIHLVPALGPLKAGLVNRFGDKGYRALFALVSAAGLGLMIWGMAQADKTPLYTPPPWGVMVTYLLVFPAFVLLASAHMKGRIRKMVRHPMLLGVLMWAVGHLLANGDRAGTWLFGSFAVYSVFGIVSSSLRDPAPEYTIKPVHDIMALVGGIALALVFVFYAHQFLFGVKII